MLQDAIRMDKWAEKENSRTHSAHYPISFPLQVQLPFKLTFQIEIKGFAQSGLDIWGMYGCESWTVKKAERRRIDAFELWCWRRLLRVPWTARRSNHPKGDQTGVFVGRTDVEAETPILWPPDAKSWLTVEDPNAGKDWGQEEKWTTEDEMAGWHHQLDGHGFG